MPVAFFLNPSNRAQASFVFSESLEECISISLRRLRVAGCSASTELPAPRKITLPIIALHCSGAPLLHQDSLGPSSMSTFWVAPFDRQRSPWHRDRNPGLQELLVHQQVIRRVRLAFLLFLVFSPHELQPAVRVESRKMT